MTTKIESEIPLLQRSPDISETTNEESVNGFTPMHTTPPSPNNQTWKKCGSNHNKTEGKLKEILKLGSAEKMDTSANITKTGVSLFKTMVKCYWKEAISYQSGLLVHVATNILCPVVLGWLINFTKDPSEQNWHGYIYALAFILLRTLYVFFVILSKWMLLCFATRLRSAGIGFVFKKALMLSNEARKTSTLGEIVNLMAVDTGHLEAMVMTSMWAWMCAAFLVIGMYLLFSIAGVATAAGLGFLLIMFAINIWMNQKMRVYQEKIMGIKDERIKIINEVLNGIKVIKLYGWEPMFIRKIEEVRERELKILLKYSIMSGIDSFSWRVSMVWILYFILITYLFTSTDENLDAETVFMSMNYINLINLAVNVLPMFVRDFVKANNSVKRLNKYLNAEDIHSENTTRDRSDAVAIRVDDADFAWEKSGMCTLQNINLSVPKGQLVAIVGTVGSGKSSLLAAILGEMHKIKGYFNINSSTAYVPQLAWIQNKTLKENILFGQQLDETFYQQVISSCALGPDLEILPAGDQTEIGEKGINLSGGQKQRVSLARAVYSQADIYLLDDPLSAVDSHVGKHIFDHVLSNDGLLAGKTRVLVTHGIHWLPSVDHIIVMSDGQVSESGTYEQLMSHNGAFAQFLIQHLKQEVTNTFISEEVVQDDNTRIDILRRLVSVTSESEVSMISDVLEMERLSTTLSSSRRSIYGSQQLMEHTGVKRRTLSGSSQHKRSNENLKETIATLEKKSPAEKEKLVVGQNRLTSDEKMEVGKVSWSVYGELMKSLGNGHSSAVLILLFCYHGVVNYSNIWLADWTDDIRLGNNTLRNSTERSEANKFYVEIYTGLALILTFFKIVFVILFQIGQIKVSRKLHSDLLSSIMHAPMSFFDTTPIGRILNRFSQDVDSIDSYIFISLETCLDTSFRCISTFVIISYTMPVFLSVVIPIIIVLYFVEQLYIRSSSQLRRITSKNRSPVYAHFSETLSGVSVIRAYQAQDRFMAESLEKVDTFQKSHLASKALNKWLESRLNVLGNIVITAACVFAVVSRNELSPGLVGLMITYALRVSGDLNSFTMEFGNLENHIVSVERVTEYTRVQAEAPWQLEAVDDSWPTTGKIEFINYSTRYREGLDLVLKEICCTINSGEKVGIVGRTGAGKSSMMLSLFRIAEASSGQILIDGLDIARLGLHTLRRKLTILPQDPVLFAGSLRMNLDPFNEKTDSDLWKALEHVHLKSFVEGLPGGLTQEVGEGGQSLSMGQRQLICLARTLLRKTQVFILDEATASVDMETDALIQKSIRENFKECTVLTIAHRLNTVLDYDRILVLDRGQIVEFDSPANLLSNHDSVFYSMASQAGLA
ncbi:multidrug resistance-associated protein 1-like isoform X2 [Physella acuta]|uniref:multidrug resistance-associated protein 1-like isoform X2 n=1 Tax=Physella acuta TaxID=109671 RepID=UPI0027DC0E50|nr:multidrug resistance-associated protein 1-like isoform X2 [Physella acuta]